MKLEPDAARSESAAATLTASAERAARLGLLLALTASVPVALATIGFIARIPVTAFHAPITAIALAWFCLRDRGPHRWSTLAWFAGIVAASMLFGTLWWDLSYDGQTYHQAGIRLLADGWNPVWDPRLGESKGAFVGALPKSAWIFAAVMAKLTGSIETGKALNVLALASGFLLAWPALVSLGVEERKAKVIAAFAALNPVALQQVTTYYVDGAVASTLLGTIAIAILWVRTGQRSWAILFTMQTALLATLKFPGAAAGAQVTLLLVGWIVWRQPSRRWSAARLAIATAASVAVLGINPFATNWALHGHPAYPAAGPQRFAWLDSVVHRDSSFRALPRPAQVAQSVLARSSDNSYAPPALKMPLAISIDEIGAFSSVDTRIGGWGPWFSGALLFGALLVALSPGGAGPRRFQTAAAIGVAMLLPLASVLALPFGFYARYAPQLWLAAIPPLLVASRPAFRGALIGVMAVNIAIVALVANGTSLIDQVLHRRQLATLGRDAAGGTVTISQTGAPFLNVDLHLTAFKIQSAYVDTPTCPHPALLLRTHARLCLAGGLSPAPAPDPRAVIGPFVPKWIRLPDPEGAR
jgi:hypothetical protein